MTSDATGFRRHIGAGGLFALSFGSIVGSSWVVVLGDWLTAAGPIGSILAFAVGGAAMLAIGACYGELTTRIPRIGGEFTYVLETLGRTPAFLVGWFLTLNYVAFAAFEGIALTILLQSLLPTISGPVLYTFFDKAVTLETVGVGLVGVVIFCILNTRSTHASVAFQRCVTFSFIAFAFVLILIGLAYGRFENMRPLVSSSRDSWEGGALWIFATTILFLNGFQAAAHSIEERSEGMPVRTVAYVMLASILAAAIFYICIIAASAAVTPWTDSVYRPLPVAFAFAAISKELSWLGPTIVVAAAFSLLKTWNAIVIVGSRLILAQARAGLLPSRLSHLNAAGAPAHAILAFSVASIAGLLMGSGGLIPILNTCAVCVALTFSLTIVVLIRHRQRNPQAATFTLPGGRVSIVGALLAAAGMGLTAAAEPLLRRDGLPVEYLILGVWAMTGFWLQRMRVAPVYAQGLQDE